MKVKILKEEKSYIDGPKWKDHEDKRHLVVSIENTNTGEKKEEELSLPSYVFKKFKRDIKKKISKGDIPASMEKKAYDREILDLIEVILMENEILDWDQEIMDYRFVEEGEGLEQNPMPGPYVKDSDFDTLEEAKEDDIKNKYNLEDGELYRGTEMMRSPHYSYNLLVQWVQGDRPKRIRFLDWMAKQIAGSGWDDTDTFRKDVPGNPPCCSKICKVPKSI